MGTSGNRSLKARAKRPDPGAARHAVGVEEFDSLDPATRRILLKMYPDRSVCRESRASASKTRSTGRHVPFARDRHELRVFSHRRPAAWLRGECRIPLQPQDRSAPTQHGAPDTSVRNRSRLCPPSKRTSSPNRQRLTPTRIGNELCDALLSNSVSFRGILVTRFGWGATRLLDQFPTLTHRRAIPSVLLKACLRPPA